MVRLGDPAEAVTLPESTRALLRTALRVEHPVRTVGGPGAVRLPDTRLGDQAEAAIEAIVGADRVLTDAAARLRHLRGKSTPDLLKVRAGDGGDAPDAVLLPDSHAEIAELLRLCERERIAVVPFGGGTSVVGGLTPERAGFAAVVSLDLSRMTRLLALDEVSRIGDARAGAARARGRGAPGRARLHDRPPPPVVHVRLDRAGSPPFAQAARPRPATAASMRTCVGLTVATPRGTIALGRAPKSSAGPDLRQLFLGSEGRLGVITSVTVQVRPLPAARVYDGWRFDAFADGASAVRTLIQDGPVPTVLRLADEAETALNLARPTELSGSSAVAEPAERRLPGDRRL